MIFQQKSEKYPTMKKTLKHERLYFKVRHLKGGVLKICCFFASIASRFLVTFLTKKIKFSSRLGSYPCEASFLILSQCFFFLSFVLI